MERFMATNDVLEGVDFDYECSKLLKDELHRRGLTYRQLAVLLNEAGMDETEKSISHKALRGTFRMSFYLQVLRVLGVNKLVIQVPMSPKYLENSTTTFSDG
jgi:sugar phosphate isomerase/epimerase